MNAYSGILWAFVEQRSDIQRAGFYCTSAIKNKVYIFPTFSRYQKLDFRLRNKKHLRNIKLPPLLRSAHEFSLTTRFQKNLKKPVVPLGVANANTSGKPCIDPSGDTHGTPEILPYAFYPDQPPTTRQTIYQLCDLHCAEAQNLISENDGRVKMRYYAISLHFYIFCASVS